MITIKTRKISHSKSRISKVAVIETGTRWSATVNKWGLFGGCTWAVCSYGLTIRSGETILFRSATKKAIEVLMDKIYNPDWHYYKDTYEQ